MSLYREQKGNYLLKNKVGNLTPIQKTNLVEKLLIFNKLITSLVNWKVKKNGQTEQEVLKDLSFVPLMKCLYDVCLLSVHNDNNKSLFSTFNSFIAYPRGPVDEDCYYHIEDLPDYTIDFSKKDGLSITKREKGKDYSFFYTELGITKTQLKSIIADIVKTNKLEQFKMAINDLKGALFFPSFRDRGSLVELSHDDLWEEACSKPDCKIDTSNIKKVYATAKRFRLSVAA